MGETLVVKRSMETPTTAFEENLREKGTGQQVIRKFKEYTPPHVKTRGAF